MKRISLFLFTALLASTAFLSVIHLTTRDTVPHGMLTVETGENTTLLVLNDLDYIAVRGTVRNGKGEEISVDAEGICLETILQIAGVGDYTRITVIADDEYRAVITASEMAQEKQFYLILEDNELRLVVFGDADSKRRVSNVKRVVIE